MTVKDVSCMLRIPISKLHYYEENGLIKPKRGENNYRIFTAEDIMKIKCILILKNLNFSILEIKEVIGIYETCENDHSSRIKLETLYNKQIDKMEEKIVEYVNAINLFKTILLFEDYSESGSGEKKTDKMIDEIYNKYIEKSEER